MENNTFRTGFTPPHINYVEHMKEDAIRRIGRELAELLETGDRFTVKLIKDEPSPERVAEEIELNRRGFCDLYPMFRYDLEIGKVHERIIEIPVFEGFVEPMKYLGTQPVPVPDYKISLTDSSLMVSELAKRLLSKVRYQLRWWTARQVNADIMAWRS